MLESLILTNFRKHESLEIQFQKDFNLISGRNNAGKSTIFYAIEYVLFGNVHGFRKIEQFMKEGTNSIEVTLCFQGKENIYIINRKHKKSRKSIKGEFSLSKVGTKKQKSVPEIVLSTSNKDKETDLSLKLSEILGISRRFFETAVHYYQGEISEILRGSDKLDIIFGITAANALIDGFKTKIKEYKKELKEYPQYELQLNNAQKELAQKTEDVNQNIEDMNRLKKELENLSKTEAILSRLEVIKSDLQQNMDPYMITLDLKDKNELKLQMIQEEFKQFKVRVDIGKIQAIQNEIDGEIKAQSDKIDLVEKEYKNLQKEILVSERAKNQFETITKSQTEILEEIEDIEEKWGTFESLLSQKKKFQKKTSRMEKEQKKFEKKIAQLQEDLRKNEFDLGDIQGMLNRRKNSRDSANCEYCGAQIDTNTIDDEIKRLKVQVSEISKSISTNEEEMIGLQKKVEKTKKEIQKGRKEESELNSTEEQLLFLRSKLTNEDLDEISKKLQAQIKKIETVERKMEKNSVKLQEMKLNQKKFVKEKEINIKTLLKYENLQESLKKCENNSKNSREQLKEEEKDLLKRLEERKRQIETFLVEYPDFHEQIHYILEDLKNLLQNFNYEILEKLLEKFGEIFIAKQSEYETAKRHLDDQKSQIQKHNEGLNVDINSINEKIEKYNYKLSQLQKMEDKKEKFDNFQKIFVEIQTNIRENLSRTLETQILSYHQQLSVDDEFDRVQVDPKDYHLSVHPKDFKDEEFYPATVYQGGGHKLLLGLAYKLALGELIGTPPFILIDEPTEFMDVGNRQNLLTNINKLSLNSQILLITHQDVEKIHNAKQIELS
ncbi:MAG: AAA family ATPase [Promethearchaeota archaeon]